MCCVMFGNVHLPGFQYQLLATGLLASRSIPPGRCERGCARHLAGAALLYPEGAPVVHRCLPLHPAAIQSPSSLAAANCTGYPPPPWRSPNSPLRVGSPVRRGGTGVAAHASQSSTSAVPVWGGADTWLSPPATRRLFLRRLSGDGQLLGQSSLMTVGASHQPLLAQTVRP
jgi:hypothetical protein